MKEIEEHLSALADGELSHSEASTVIQHLCADPTLRACWGRYQMIREGLRGELPATVMFGLPERVAQSLAEEP